MITPALRTLSLLTWKFCWMARRHPAKKADAEWNVLTAAPIAPPATPATALRAAPPPRSPVSRRPTPVRLVTVRSRFAGYQRLRKTYLWLDEDHPSLVPHHSPFRFHWRRVAIPVASATWGGRHTTTWGNECTGHNSHTRHDSSRTRRNTRINSLIRFTSSRRGKGAPD